MKNILLLFTVYALVGCGSAEEDKDTPAAKHFTQTAAMLLFQGMRNVEEKTFCKSVQDLSSSKDDFQFHYPQEWIFVGNKVSACELTLRSGASSPLCISDGVISNAQNVYGLQGFALEYDLEYEFAGRSIRTYVDIGKDWATIGHGDNRFRKLSEVSKTDIQNIKVRLANCSFP